MSRSISFCTFNNVLYINPYIIIFQKTFRQIIFKQIIFEQTIFKYSKNQTHNNLSHCVSGFIQCQSILINAKTIYAKAFLPVQSDSQASEWCSYFKNDVLVPITIILFINQPFLFSIFIHKKYYSS